MAIITAPDYSIYIINYSTDVLLNNNAARLSARQQPMAGIHMSRKLSG